MHGTPVPGFPQQGQRATQNGAIVPMNTPPMGTIPLNTIIDFIIHKTYHDIVVMADLLPGKSDIERKIEIAHFANRTRQLVIRLLAVVKWASSVGQVIKCEEITQFLDHQAMLFVDTADKLHTLANQLVVQARLPNFAIPAAVDVLTTGTYPRLPRAIRDKIVPPDPITPIEKAATLKRLNQIIMFRLVTTNVPLQIMDMTVDKGMVRLVVPREFQAILTLMGDGDDVPWRLLKLEFMVEDRETGSGRALVHDLQINYIHELVQSRLIANEDPLQDLYNVLHSFCLSLQLEVLQAQAIRLIQERWGRLVQIDEYQPGNKVTLSYWRLSPYEAARQEAMSVTVRQKQTEDAWSLVVMHSPSLMLQNIELVEKASRIRDLSIERLLSDTVKVRSYHKLFSLKQMLQKHIKNDTSFVESDQSCLVIQLLQPCQNSEKLRISVDPQTGVYIPALSGLDQNTLDEIERAINEIPTNLLISIPRLRMKLARERCKMSTQNLPAMCMDTLLLANQSSHPIRHLAKELVFVKLTNFTNYYIVVELHENKENDTKVQYSYHLLTTASDTHGLVVETSRHADILDIKADALVKLEAALCDSQSCDVTADNEASEVGSHFNSELAQLVSVCDARLPFVNLTQELSQEGFLHQGVLEEGVNVGLCVKLLTFPEILPSVLNPELTNSLLSSLLDCSFRMVDKSSKIADPLGEKIWNAELIFCNCPIKSSRVGNVTHVMLQLDTMGSESPVKIFKEEWISILKLYEPVARFAEVLGDERSQLHAMVTVHSYNYKSIVLKYGQEKQCLVTIKWSTQGNKFLLHFGRIEMVGSNSHNIASHYLNNVFNSDPDIGKLVQILHDTSEVMQAISCLPVIPLIGMGSSQPGNNQQNAKNVTESFSIIMQTPVHIRLIFRAIYVLDIFCLPNKKMAIRDGALSRFDSSKVVEGMVPIAGFKSFMSLFDSQGNRKRSAAERDNPPSPDSQSNAGLGLGDMRNIAKGVWAGSSPIIIPQSVFTKLTAPLRSVNVYPPSTLELFLGNTLIRRELDQIIRNPFPESPYYSPPQNLFQKTGNNDLTTLFAANSLMFHCSMQNTAGRPQLSFGIQQVPPMAAQERGLQLENWQAEDLLVLERFFRVRVACPPFRTSNVHAFCYIISAKSHVLRDFINVMRLELENYQNNPAIKWTPQLCLTVPPRLKYAPPGLPAVYVKDKILIFVQMTPRLFNPNTPPMQRQSIIMPIVWHPIGNNISTLPPNNNAALQKLELHIKQLMENRQPNQQCNMFTAIRYLMEHYAHP